MASDNKPALREQELRGRESAISRREQAVSRREQALTRALEWVSRLIVLRPSGIPKDEVTEVPIVQEHEELPIDTGDDFEAEIALDDEPEPEPEPEPARRQRPVRMGRLASIRSGNQNAAIAKRDKVTASTAAKAAGVASTRRAMAQIESRPRLAPVNPRRDQSRIAGSAATTQANRIEATRDEAPAAAAPAARVPASRDPLAAYHAREAERERLAREAEQLGLAPPVVTRPPAPVRPVRVDSPEARRKGRDALPAAPAPAPAPAAPGAPPAPPAPVQAPAQVAAPQRRVLGRNFRP